MQPEIGSSLRLKSNVLKAACITGQSCSSYGFSSSQSVKVLAPLNPIRPSIVMSSSPAISACDDLLLDPTNAQGSGGRPWISVIWNITGATSSAVNLNKLLNRFKTLSSWLNQHYADTSQVIKVPNHYLNASITYSISLTLVNFLMQSSTSSVSVTVASSDATIFIPQVRIYGPNALLYRWMAISFYATVSLPPCFPPGGNLSYSYSWSLYSNLQFVSNVASSSSLPRLFTIPPYSLAATTSYTLQATVTVTSFTNGKLTSSSASDSLNFNIGQSGIAAVIAGGNQRQISPFDSAEFDASSSYDIDYPSDSSLQFMWSCVQSYPQYGVQCNLCGASITLPKLSLHCSLTTGTYNVSVLVSNSRNARAFAFTILLVSNVSAPQVVVNNAVGKYNPSNNLVLTGLITAARSCIAHWFSRDISQLQLTKVALTSISRQFPSGSQAFQLSISANSFSGGVVYSFSLQASYDNEAVSSSTVLVTMNQPPFGGSLNVVPTHGVALFAFSTFAWVDDVSDLPLQYIFSYYALNPLTEKNIIKNLDLVPTASSILGQGLSSLSYSVGCLVFAVDIYDGQANATAFVTVYPIKITSNLLSSVNSELDAAFSQQNSYGVTQIVNSVLSTLNGVQCAVPKACNTIGRQVCQSTANTCGSCLPGFIGVSGDSNVPCNPLTALNPTGNSACETRPAYLVFA